MSNRSAKNYFALQKFSLLYDHYAFVDAPEYLADQLFIRHQVTVHFGHEFTHPDHPYVIIFCKVRKKDSERFLLALDELHNKMILCGHPNYEDFCHEFIDRVRNSVHSPRRKRCIPNETHSTGKTEQARSERAS